MIHVRQDRSAGNVVLAFSGGFDVRAAEEMVTLALQQPVDLRLVIDVSHASTIHDSALGRLVDSLPRFRPRFIRGVNKHQARVLSLLGEKMDEPGGLAG
jgi:anti-anti-sigma regulatory factor